MNEQMTMAEQLAFVTDNQLAGYRLERVEVLNWGTFDGQVFKADLGGNNTLLTGQIGSGKSTIVDAITTLMVPSRNISYNKASGAHAKERSLHSYVLGQFKHERSSTNTSKPTYLRDNKTFSVILAVYRNAGFDEVVTIAQVFWANAESRRPDQLYVVAHSDLSISVDFSNFDRGIDGLRKRLRATGAIVTQSPSDYYQAMRQALSIHNPQALKLFNQAISMKEVGNLTDFVRDHMLEPTGVAERIESLISHFDDLDRAHESIKKAAHQISLLQPLSGFMGDYRSAIERTEFLSHQKDAVQPYFNEFHIGLLEQEIASCRLAEEQAIAARSQAEYELHAIQEKLGKVQEAIYANGGGRIESIQRDLAREVEITHTRRALHDRYVELVVKAGLAPASTEDIFVAQRARLQEELAAAEVEQASLGNQKADLEFSLRQERDQERDLSQELESLASNPSNIERSHRDIQLRLGKELGIDPDHIPFAGELIQVREDASEWEGAAERALRGFGLSMLVPEEHYRAVAQWVDSNHLRQRFVYYRVAEARHRSTPSLHPKSLVRKLAIKPDTQFYSWLENELAHRFNFACADSHAEFQRETHAITTRGQIKSPGGRHEKDDRHHIGDRRNYILGWRNEAKIRALERARETLRNTILATVESISGFTDNINASRARSLTLAGLTQFQSFRDMDWQSSTKEAERLKAELSKLEAASDALAQLRVEAKQLQSELATIQLRRDEAAVAAGMRAKERAAYSSELDGLLQHPVEQITDERITTALGGARVNLFGNTDTTLRNIGSQIATLKDKLQSDMDQLGRATATSRDGAIGAMTDFRNKYPADCLELVVSMDGAGEFEQLLQRLLSDDLPRFERDFKEMLNTNTINEIGGFNSYLIGERDKIRTSVDKINKSLLEIDYNEGRYIRLEPTPADDQEIRDFQLSLRACTDGSSEDLTDEQFSEDRFNRVKVIIDRFRGQDGTTEQDRRWTEKVTDVRQWFFFAVSERYRHDDTEHEMYSDSSGKSGGQKEKLAYTVLAASLAYQFGLTWGETRSRSFRFVVIDEAFGRSSDDSTRYALDLFEKLSLQLLIVTPAQKIHVIEPYVAGVVLATPDKNDGRSYLANISMEQLQDMKQAFIEAERAAR